MTGRRVRHHEPGDDISLWLPDENCIMTGDLVQPKGESYDKGHWESALPFYVDGDNYLSSLQKVIGLHPELVMTCHEGVYRGTQALNTNVRVVERTRELARKLVNENPSTDDETICAWIFDTISWERGVLKDVAEQRRKSYHYYGCDVHGIVYFVRKARKGE